MQASPPNQAENLDLENCTLDEIVDVLCAGKSINLPLGAGSFTLDLEDARLALQFYARRRDLWPQGKLVSASEVDQLIEAIDKPQSHVPRSNSANIGSARPCWRIKELRAHRFAGLQRHCNAAGKAPEVLTLSLDRDVTCIWGFNGAGKSSLQSAIMWCLTGKAHRSQHKPSEVHSPINVDVISENGESGSNSSFTLPVIVPLPSASDLSLLGDLPACDTWVELALQNQDGENVTVRRELRRNARGTVTVSVSGLDDLGLPQWAIEAGTLMPAIAANMRFDEKTSFAEAISQLTGLRPLQDLGMRLPRLVRRLEKDDTDTVTDAKDAARIHFIDSKTAFIDAWRAQLETLGPEPDLLTPDKVEAENSCINSIAIVRERLVQHQASGLKDVETILGTTASLATPERTKALLDQLASAREQLTGAALKGLPSLRTIHQIKEISDEDRNALFLKLEELAERAVAQVKRQQNKEKAARQQLYTMVAQWHHRQHPDETISDCPVCGSDLTQVPSDALLDSDVAAALQAGRQAHHDATKSLADWQKEAASELLESLPESLKIFAEYKGRGNVSDLYKSAYVNEALKDRSFEADLKPILRNARKLWDQLISVYPLSTEQLQDPINLPQELASGLLASRFANLQHVVTLSVQRMAVEDVMQQLLGRFLGVGVFSRGEKLDESLDLINLPIRHQLSALYQAITTSEPLISLTRQIDVIEDARKRWVLASHRLKLIKRTAKAIQQLTRLPELVECQVNGLIQLLDTRTTAWLDLIYRPHYNGGPKYLGLDPARSQGVGLYAGLGKVRVQAHEIMNSSHLRACVWAFVFSLWERIRERSGVLEVLQLDDPQTFFDPINTENLAAVVPALVKAGMAIIITSNDHRFIAAVKDKLPKSSATFPSWTMLQISPLSLSRLTVALTPTVEEVNERRQAWAEDSNDIAASQEFVERVRLHIENRLWDLLAADPMLLYKPTLADLIAHIASARNAGELPFQEPPFEKLLSCNSLKPGTHFYRTINQAHHDLRKITPHDAGVIDEGFTDVDRLMRSCAAAYARFMGRLTREDEQFFFATAPEAPAVLTNHEQKFRILGDFNANAQTDIDLGGESLGTLSLESLGAVALYAIHGDSLGSFARQGQVVIVSIEGTAKCGDPVIALNSDKTFARRYHSDKTDTSRLMLACDQNVSDRVAPALALSRNKVRLMPIVGVLYDSVLQVGPGEARNLDSSEILRSPLFAARIIDRSGYPLIRHNDWVLLEPLSVSCSEDLEPLRGELVALVACREGDKQSYLKRIGIPISGDVRNFDSAGTFGESVAIACTFEGDSSLLKLMDAWRVRGVLRGVS
ncbi:ATP-binding protein [Pseudomonas sp. ML2-2023-6]|uniref:ATP-binding protein n=1 Tax=Pseudomonas sp. ML2-2023-6 TaxID=3122376 RepID=UPI0030D1F8D8